MLTKCEGNPQTRTHTNPVGHFLLKVSETSPCWCPAGRRQGRRGDGCPPRSETSARTAEEEATSAASRAASAWSSLRLLSYSWRQRQWRTLQEGRQSDGRMRWSWNGERFQERMVECDLRKRVANPGRLHAAWVPQSVSLRRNWFSSFVCFFSYFCVALTSESEGKQLLSHCVCLYLPPTGRLMVYAEYIFSSPAVLWKN